MTDPIESLTTSEQQNPNRFYWFYLVAVLSFVNSIFSILDYGSIYVIGLGISQFLDHLMVALKEFLPERINLITVVGMTVSLLFSLLFALFGYLGNKKNKTAVFIGLVLYLADTGMTIWLESYESAFFHLLGLVVIGWNLRLLYKKDLEAANA
jgi:uncharacterized membrane protein YjjP (DUF1212 family)